jgi:cell division protein FtsQ
MRVLFRVALAAGLVAASIAIVRFVDRYARTSPEFAIETLAITGNARVPGDELEETMGIAVGDNVFSRSPEEVRASLELHPWIASATVRRRLPRTFEVEVRERTPALMLVLEQPYLVDEDATVFKAFEEGDPVDLPVITGVDPERFQQDRGYRTELLTASIALVSEWETANLSRREPIAEIHVEPDEGLTLFVGEDGTEIRLGRGPYRGKLSRLRRVLDELGRRQSRPLYVYLDNVRRPDRVTVRVR